MYEHKHAGGVQLSSASRPGLTGVHVNANMEET